MKRLIVFLSCAVTLSQFVQAQPGQPVITMNIPWQPEPTVIEDKPTVYYELHVTNIVPDTLLLERLQITGSDSTRYIMLQAKDMHNRFALVKEKSHKQTPVLPPGMTGVFYIEYAVKSSPVVIHTVVLEVVNARTGMRHTTESTLVTKAKNNLAIAPPLRGGPWAAVYDPSWERGHRRVMYTTDNKAHIPGRFAIDFIKVDLEGRYAIGNEDSIHNWLGYGDDVLAVSNGIVVGLRTDFTESVTLSKSIVPRAEDATGNYIAIDIGNNHIAFYEHLKPGSILVKKGQRVRQGQVIAALGFTGQTTGPHLHFHVADKNSPLGAEGIPFEFEKFEMLGSYRDLSGFGKQRWNSMLPKTSKHAQRPSANSVIQFTP